MNINNCEDLLNLLKISFDRIAKVEQPPRNFILSEADMNRIDKAINELIHTKKVIKDVLDNDVYEIDYQQLELTSDGLRKLEDLIK